MGEESPLRDGLVGAPPTGMLRPDLAFLCRRAVEDRWLLAFDFDGTLAPFTTMPGQTALDGESAALLGRLAAERRVAVISGRAVADVRARLPAGPLIIGNHGGEGLPGMDAALATARTVTALWLGLLATRFAEPGCWIEDKGVSLTFHWRGAADQEVAARAAQGLAQGLEPAPQLIPGHSVLNCLPPGLPNKGGALLRLMAGMGGGNALFVGDDWTDATVFRLNDPRIHGIQVGDLDLGTTWRLKDQGAVVELLRTLVAAL